MKFSSLSIFATLLFIAVGASADVQKGSSLLRFTHEASSTAGMGPLEPALLQEGASEIRIWIGFGVVQPDEMLRLRVDANGAVSGELLIHFSGDFSHMSRKDAAYFHRAYTKNCTGLKKGPNVETCIATFPKEPDWNALYQQLKNLEVKTLPDESELPNTDGTVMDGIAMVVEIKDGKTYRSYEYSNPAFRQEPEALAASNIIKVVATLARQARGT